MRMSTGGGPARAEVDLPAGEPGFLMVLTHGSGGGTDTPDLGAAVTAALAAGGVAVRVTQPYRVRGARAPGSAPRQDEAWLEIIRKLRRRYRGLPLIQGGRSNGARVACRTAASAGAAGVLALAFPLHPPGRPDRSRADELAAPGTSVLVINGSRDPFGVPEPAGSTTVVVLDGQTHALTGASGRITAEVTSWLGGLGIGAGRAAGSD